MTIYDSVRQLLSQGDTGQALRLLITHLENEPSVPEALRTLRVIEANYSAARQKEIKGILDFSEAQLAYSKTNDSLLSVLEDLAAGRKPTLTVESDEKQTSRIYWLIGGGILLLLGLIAGILLRNNKQSATVVAPIPVAAECPDFDTSGVTVMLIPFQDLGDAKSRPELAIQTLIRDLTQRNNVKSDVELFAGNLFATNPPDMDDAAKIGRQCAAKMVIWGLYEKTDQGISLDVRYVFTEQPNLPGGAVADTFRNLSELKTSSAKFKSLEDAVFTLCTFMVLHEGNMDLAKKWINKVKEPDANAQKLKAMLNQ